MKTNFDFLLKEPQFEPFAEAAVSAERVLHISPALCATACRTALEFAVKWLYSIDSSLTKPYADKLVTLISTEDFQDLIPSGMAAKINYLRKLVTMLLIILRASIKTRLFWLWKTYIAFWTF